MNVRPLTMAFAFVLSLIVAAQAEPYQGPVPALPPRHAEAEPTLPGPANPNLARFYFYRVYDFGGTSQWTAVWLNGAKAGDSAPGTYFYRDVQPGTYAIAVRSDWANAGDETSVTVKPGSTTFIEVYSINVYEPVGGTYYRPTLFGDHVVTPETAQAAVGHLAHQPE
jgi:Protein of unknown function (DUF2846)